MTFSKFILKYRITILCLIMGLSFWAALGIKQLEVSVKIENFFVKGDSGMTSQERFTSYFGQNNVMGVLIESDDIFDTKTLEKIYEINEAVQAIPYINQSISILNAPGRAGYSFDTEGQLTNTPHQLDSIKKAFQADPSLNNLLFDRKGKETIITANLHLDGEAETLSEFDLGELIYNTIEEIETTEGITITPVATSVFAYRKKVEMMADLAKVLLGGAIIAAILCLIVFKNFQSFLGTIALISITPAVVFGLLGWLNISVDSTFISIPILLTMGISIGNAIHVNHFFRIDVEFHHDRKKAIMYAISHSWRPILFTTITTISALLSFMFVKVNAIKMVGVTSATCVLVMYILCMTIFPIMLSMGKGKVKASPKRSKYEGWFIKLSSACIRQQKSITIAFVGVSIIAIWGTSYMTIDFNSVDMMGSKLPHMKQQLKIKKSAICSNEIINLTIVANKNDFRNPDKLSQLLALEKEIEKLPLVKRASTINNLLAQANMSLHGGVSEFHKVPQEKGKLYKTYYQLRKNAPDFLQKWITADYATTRIYIELSDFSSKIIKSDIDKINELVGLYFPESNSSFLSGATYQMALMNQHMTQGLVNSVGIALMMITILMMLCFRSIKLGLIAMFPNVFPVLICGGVVGFFNIPLEFVTMTVAPLILGLAVDDTIHFISSLKKNIKMHNDYDKGIKAAYKEVGLAISKTTMILTATFLAFTISDVNSIMNMGILSCIGIVAAFMADLLIVPILIRFFKPFTLRK